MKNLRLAHLFGEIMNNTTSAKYERYYEYNLPDTDFSIIFMIAQLGVDIKDNTTNKNHSKAETITRLGPLTGASINIRFTRFTVYMHA